MKAITKGRMVIVLMIGFREELMGKITNATYASMVTGKLKEERANTESRVRVMDGSRFVTIIAISFTMIAEDLLLVLEILDEFLTVKIIEKQNNVNIAILIKLRQI